jgi:multimeric flavodoxin WrbA
MTNVEVLVGSPRKNGNTSIMANYLQDNLKKEGISSNISFLYDIEIKPCTDCRACKKGNMNCVLKDEASLLYSRMEKADIIVFGTPIYWFGPSATMKLFIDRLRPYYLSNKLAGKKAALLLPAGEGAKDCDLTIEMFKRIFQTLGMVYLWAVESMAYNPGDVIEDNITLKSLKRLAKTLRTN